MQQTSSMPPHYAPSLRSRLAPLLLFLQTGFIILFAFYTEIERNGNADDFSKYYPGEFYFCELGGGGSDEVKDGEFVFTLIN